MDASFVPKLTTATVTSPVATEQTTHFNGDLDTDLSLEHWVMELPEGEAGCEFPSCAASAQWRGINAPCGHGSLYCTPHKEDGVRGQSAARADAAYERGRVTCSYCHAPCLGPQSWLPI